MAVTDMKLKVAILEAEKFIHRAYRARARMKQEPLLSGCKETAAVRRQSMELSRVLVYIRK